VLQYVNADIDGAPTTELDGDALRIRPTTGEPQVTPRPLRTGEVLERESGGCIEMDDQWPRPNTGSAKRNEGLLPPESRQWEGYVQCAVEDAVDTTTDGRIGSG